MGADVDKHIARREVSLQKQSIGRFKAVMVLLIGHQQQRTDIARRRQRQVQHESWPAIAMTHRRRHSDDSVFQL